MRDVNKFIKHILKNKLLILGFINKNIFLFVGIVLFLILTIPFLNILPYLDGNIDFIQTTEFYSGGINKYFTNWNSVHPPLKLVLIFPFYLLLGISPISYSLAGILIGILGIISIFLLTKNLFGGKTANLASIFFSVYPLFIANSIFAMRDLILAVFILTALLFYIKKKYFFFAFFCSLAILTKESALLMPAVTIFIEVFFIIFQKKHKLFPKLSGDLIFLSLPFFVYYIWKLIIDSSNKTSWNEWIFADNQNKGAIFTIVNNLITFDFINPYAAQHWKQLFILNFNWVFLIIIFLGLFIYISGKSKYHMFKKEQNLKVILIIFIFSISYLLTVLSLQTYTIPRYALPLIPFLIIALAKSITIIKNRTLQTATLSLVLILVVFSNFFSIDPITTRLWGKSKIFNQNLYALNDHLAGNDGITYNVQYLLIAKERSKIIQKATIENKTISSDYCRWIFPDPNNEEKMVQILNLKTNLTCNNLN